MAKTNIRGTQITDGSGGVDLTVDVFGVLPVANGGTGSSSGGGGTTDASLLTSGTLADARLPARLGIHAPPQATDFNALTDAGWYFASTDGLRPPVATSGPPMSGLWAIQVISGTSNQSTIQLAFEINSGPWAFMRQQRGTTWQGWREIDPEFLRDRANHTGTQAASTITGLATVATSGSKADVGLGNVDNTSDSAKPVSTVQKTYTDQAAARRPSYSYASPVSGLANGYSAEFGIYNFKSSNTRILNQGLANCMGKSGMTEHLWIGDSLSSGTVSAVGVYVHDWLNAVALAFRDNLANTGIPGNGTGFVRCVDSTTGSDARWSFTGSWTNTNQSMLASTAVNSTATFTADRSGTICDVWFYDGTGATFTIAVNGVIAATVVCNGTSAWKYQHLTGLNLQVGSKVTITETVHGTFGTFFSGLKVWTPNAGLVMNNVAQGGSLASGSGSTSWVDVGTNTAPGQVFQTVGGTTRTVTDAGSTVGSPNLTSATAAFTAADVGRSIDQTQGAAGPMFPYGSYIGAVTNGTTAVIHLMVNGVSTPTNSVATGTITGQTVRIGREPSCIHIALGVNDMLGGASMATLTAAITTIRNRYPNSDCILHLEPEMAYSFVPQATQQAYWQAMYTLADTLDLPLYDWRDRVGTYAQGQASGVYGDQNVHLTGATQSSLGASLAQVVGGGNAILANAQVPVRAEDLSNKRYVDGKIRSGGLLTQSVTSNVETIVAQAFIPANTLAVGSQITYEFVTKLTIASVTNARLRVGQVGTVAGDTAFAVAGTGISSLNTHLLHGVMTVLSIGSAGTINGTGVFAAGTAVNLPTGAPATVAIDTTKDNYISLTAFSASSALTNYAAKIEVNV